MLGFLFDLTRCIGCKACQMACKEGHGLAAGDHFRRVRTPEETVDTAGWRFFSGACNHCAAPLCAAACPTGAMHRAADGTVVHEDALCIGCGRCVHACPYGAPSLNGVTGYAQKCDACAARRAGGEEPLCTAVCPTRALHFGELEELRERFPGAAPGALPFLPPAERTGPRLLLRGAPPAPEGHEPPAVPEEPAPAPPPVPADGVHILILGGGTAAVAALRAIRARSSGAEIVVVSRERGLPYCRPMLSKGLLNSFSMDRYPILTRQELEEGRIAWLEGAEAVALDAAARRVALADGRVLCYDRCILALGGTPVAPPIPGADLPGVLSLRCDRDLHALRRAMLTARRAVVVGGGAIGLETAWALKRAGLAVNVAELSPRLMGRALDDRSAALLRAEVEGAGIGAVLGVPVAEIAGTGRVEEVRLADGSSYPADLVLLSIGSRPDTALAAAAGAEIGAGVAVNGRMETSLPHVYACGDCTGGPALWTRSLRQGETAGANALGAELDCVEEPEPVILHAAGTAVLSVGDPGGDHDRVVLGRAVPPEGMFRVAPAPRRPVHLTFTFRDGRMSGAALVGGLELAGLAVRGVREGWDLETLGRMAGERGVELHV